MQKENNPCSQSKKNSTCLPNQIKKPLSLIDFASALEDSSPNSILFIAVLKPKIYFVPEIVTKRARETDLKNSKYLESKMSLNSLKLKWSF